MLVLGRYVGERIIIDVPASATPTRIEVVVSDIRGGRWQVKLGVTAPDEVAVNRAEIVERGVKKKGVS